jgi:outer membrane protein OmpA-like peptidoglycan-associated protein
MNRVMQRMVFWTMAGMLTLSIASYAQENTSANQMKFAAGQKVKISGQIVKAESDKFIMHDVGGADVLVKLTAATVIKEKKINLFRGAKGYKASDLVRGLEVDVEGLGEEGGALAARDIKFTQTELLVANSVESRVTPVEGRLTDSEGRLTRSEENARHLSGQVDEVRDVANTARGNAKSAQETADSAVAGVAAANGHIAEVDKATNARITAVDDFEVKGTVAVRFKVGSSVLSPEAKSALDQLVKEALAQKGYVVEVTGFASSDGNADQNRVLSQHRADNVVRYLADNMVPLRRIVTPMGFGAKNPVADNQTRPGREENRRVEVKILVSKGLAASEGQGNVTIIKEQK